MAGTAVPAVGPGSGWLRFPLPSPGPSEAEMKRINVSGAILDSESLFFIRTALKIRFDLGQLLNRPFIVVCSPGLVLCFVEVQTLPQPILHREDQSRGPLPSPWPPPLPYVARRRLCSERDTEEPPASLCSPVRTVQMVLTHDSLCSGSPLRISPYTF